ncbi:MAG: hypothetical protein JNM45_15640, partial [Rhizobiales bacterium]|nr:hypothetical protein [Hyphomicrobiales bacterium]
MQWLATLFALVAGAVLFCGSSLQDLVHDVVALAGFCSVIALLGAAAIHVRKAFSDALARSGRTCRENLWKEIVADGLLAVVLALAALWICTYAFDHAHDALEWPAAFLYFGVLTTCLRLLRERNRSLLQMPDATTPLPQPAA